MALLLEDLLKKQQASGQIKTASDAAQRRIPKNIVNERPIQLPDANKSAAIAGKDFVGPRNNPGITSKEAQSFINRPAFETIVEQSKSNAIGKLARIGQIAKGLATPAAILAPAAGLLPTLADSKVSAQKKIDAGVELAAGLGGGVVGAGLAKTGIAVANVARSAPLPPLLKAALTAGGALAGSLGGQAFAQKALSEQPNQIPVIETPTEQVAAPEVPVAQQFVQQLTPTRVGGGISGGSAGRGTSLLGIANRRLAENQALLSRPGAVEVIRGLQRSAFLGDGVEVSLEPGVEIGREREGRAFGQPGVASTELKTDALRDVEGMKLAGRFAVANRPPSFSQLQGMLAQQALTGTPEEAAAAIQQAEILGQLKNAFSGKKKPASAFEVEKRRLAEALADPEISEDDRTLALKRANELKTLESLLGN